MSRVGRKPIIIPDKVKVSVTEHTVSVEGPRGKLSMNFSPNLQMKVENNQVHVNRPIDTRENRSLHGLTRSLLNNMVIGVTHGYEKNLELVGVGYRVEPFKAGIKLQVGFSKPVEFIPPTGIVLKIEGNNKIKVQGIDKYLVGETAASIRNIRTPEPYKGKGIMYTGEHIIRKVGKSGQTK